MTQRQAPSQGTEPPYSNLSLPGPSSAVQHSQADQDQVERTMNILSNEEQHSLSKSNDVNDRWTETDLGTYNKDEGPMAPPSPQVPRTDTRTFDTDAHPARYAQPDPPSLADQPTPDEEDDILHILKPVPISGDHVTGREISRSRTRETRSRRIPDVEEVPVADWRDDQSMSEEYVVI